MNIAIVYDLIYPFSIGGVECRNFDLARELALRNHQVHLFGVKMWQGASTIKVARNIYIHGISRYRRKYSFSGRRNAIDPLIFSLKLLCHYDLYIIC